ncbi:hypothetical protein [Gordonia phthalatica]|uniref:hypothetical protein n=1 Tax=Gordonia phthalatica TaxID=1136941 RepID=UPI000AE469B2
MLNDQTIDYARSRAAAGTPMAVVSDKYSTVVPFMLGNNGYTIALVADVNDPIQLDEVLDRVQSRIGAVTRTVRGTDSLPAA